MDRIGGRIATTEFIVFILFCFKNYQKFFANFLIMLQKPTEFAVGRHRGWRWDRFSANWSPHKTEEGLCPHFSRRRRRHSGLSETKGLLSGSFGWVTFQTNLHILCLVVNDLEFAKLVDLYPFKFQLNSQRSIK